MNRRLVPFPCHPIRLSFRDFIRVGTGWIFLLAFCGVLTLPVAAQDAPETSAQTEASQSQAAEAQAADAETAESEITPVGLQGGKFGVGTASSWPAYGLSGTYHFNEKVTGQAVLGFFGAISSFTARGWYRFNQNEGYDLYGYGSAGLYRHEYRFRGFVDETETTLGIGAGVGIDVSLGHLFNADDFPPIFANSELGLTYANFDVYNFSVLSFGFGVHYRFGQPQLGQP